MKIERQILSKKFLEKIEPLLKKHKKEIAYFNTPLSFNKELYIYADSAGSYRAYVAKSGERIVGYVGYWLTEDPHSNENTQATQDVFYVDKDYRGKWIGLKLLKFSEKELKSEGAGQVVQQSTLISPISPLFKRLGYEKISEVYKKEI